MDNKNYKDQSKKRLKNNITKKFNTTTIGALATFEEDFGFLWGHGIEYDRLSEDQKEWRKVWSRTRTDILDLGNSNLRAVQNELNYYTISWDRYVTKFHFQDEDKSI